MRPDYCIRTKAVNKQVSAYGPLPLPLHQGSTHPPFWQHQDWDRIVRHAKEFGERMGNVLISDLTPVLSPACANLKVGATSEIRKLQT
jgi:hypothetical protein